MIGEGGAQVAQKNPPPGKKAFGETSVTGSKPEKRGDGKATKKLNEQGKKTRAGRRWPVACSSWRPTGEMRKNNQLEKSVSEKNRSEKLNGNGRSGVR
jgi:hypothetical protein